MATYRLVNTVFLLTNAYQLTFSQDIPFRRPKELRIGLNNRLYENSDHNRLFNVKNSARPLV